MPEIIKSENRAIAAEERVLTSPPSFPKEIFASTPTRSYQALPETAPSRPTKKIPPELRRPKLNFKSEPVWYKRYLWKLKADSQFQRAAVQAAFVLLCLGIGVEFYFFMQWGLAGGQGTFSPRPPGVEGFLPISALISLKYWLLTGVINNVHPSGLFIFIAILATGILLKRSFCSWMCPVGTLSEGLWRLGKKIFGGNLPVTRWLDYPLRALKYLLLFFFAWAIWNMDELALQTFIYSPYNKVADIKMYLFFADISKFALWTIFVLMLLSMAIKNFWCRYLCPYGGLLGLVSWLSPLKISRQPDTCVDCELCTKVCPASIKVHQARRVWSDECMGCLACVQICPVKNTLDMRTGLGNRKVPPTVFAGLVAGLFVAITGLAMLMGHWQNAIAPEEYRQHFQNINSSLYQHNRGEVPSYDAAHNAKP